VLQEAQRLGITSLAAVKTARVYRLEGVSEEEAQHLAQVLFCDPISQEFQLNAPMYTDACMVKEVAYKPGVMNPEAASIMKAAKDLGIKSLLAVDSSTEYAFYSVASNSSIASDVDIVLGQLLVNKTVERVVCAKPATLIVEGEPGPITIIPICSLDDQGLMALSNNKLFLDLTEMRAIQKHAGVIGRDLSDMELETFGVAWSQHCDHKTFKSRLVIDGVEKDPLYTRLKRTAEKYSVGVISAFVDNSGVVDFYDGYAICGKVETHNSPSALEPYGGAATGTGGVFRDVLGTGKSAKIILSTDMFCFAPPDLALEKLPPGCLHPHYLLRRVVAGVRDYGNRMGVPTSNGSVHFHEDFRAKPTVIVGAYGIMPVEDAIKGQPKPGDLVVTIGGRTGRDGIHGATFSSGEMTDQTVVVNSSAVQIGNAIEEKRTSDAVLACRRAGLIRAITDCGAGGFASAIGEMGSETGVRVYLERAPLKYSGLAPWEIWISESQERMVLAVVPENIDRVIEISRVYGAEAVVLGEFTADKRLVVSYNGVIACDLDMEFLYHGLPQRVLQAHWTKPVIEEKRTSIPSGYSEWIGRYCRVLAYGDVCSKEPIIRLYDHTVQGTNALQPYSGVNNDGPNDAVVLAPILGKPYGMVVSHGLNPVLTRIDPYWGAVWSAVEAIANFTAVGGHPSNVNLIDNFI
jgi:phosphoribosylformylglycinamidine synthase